MATKEIAPIEVQATPAVVNVPNLERVKTNVSAMIEQYSKFPVAKETEKGAKEVRKEMNALASALHRSRIDTEKQLLGNWPTIKEEMFDLEKQAKSVSSTIGDQLTELDNSRKESKRQMIWNEINKKLADYPPLIETDLEGFTFDDRWLNKSYSWPQMLGEIESKLSAMSEFRKNEIEHIQLSKEVINSYAKELQIEPDGYIHMLGSLSVDSIKSQMKRDVELAEAKLKAKHEAVEQECLEQQKRVEEATQVGDKLIDDDTGEVIDPTATVEKRLNFVFNVTSINENEFNQIINGFKQMGLQFTWKEV